MEEHGELQARRERRAAAEIEAIAVGVLRGRMGTLHGGAALSALAARVAAGDLDPYAAADDLLKGIE
jgi:LAO/AO transport system kinase